MKPRRFEAPGASTVAAIVRSQKAKGKGKSKKMMDSVVFIVGR
jgi:hypothetical protein